MTMPRAWEQDGVFRWIIIGVRKLRESRRIRGDRNDDLMSLASERELFAQDRLTAALEWWLDIHEGGDFVLLRW